MRGYGFHPAGMVVRSTSRGQRRFAVLDAVTGREVSFGTDWAAAYTKWIRGRRASMPVPDPLPLAWLVREFAAYHRPADRRLRIALEKDVRQLEEVFDRMGNPFAPGLSEAGCVAFRIACASVPRLGQVRTETLIRRVRQVWRWACLQGWVDGSCPWHARDRQVAIREEVVELVARYLPEDVLAAIKWIQGPTGCEIDNPVAVQTQRLSAEIVKAAKVAARQVQRDGRLDMIAAVRRCQLSWFLGTSMVLSFPGQSATRETATSRIELADRLRRQRASRRK
jgi:hypothetical protein